MSTVPETAGKPGVEVPEGLSERAAATWSKVVDEYVLAADELEVLREACRLLSRLDRLDEALRDAPMTVSGSRGQQTAHPLLVEARMTAVAVGQLFARLALPRDEVDGTAAHRSHAGRQLVSLRYR